MSQNKKYKLLVLALVAGLFSLPLTWFSIEAGYSSSFVRAAFMSVMNQPEVELTGWNLSVTLLVKTPLWFIMLIPISASLLQLLHAGKLVRPSALTHWVLAIVGFAWIALTVLMGLQALNQAVIGIGLVLGLFAATVPLLCLMIPTPGRKRTTDFGELKEKAL